MTHRLHFYQILVNERKMDHRLVSTLYFVVQVICSALIVVLYLTLAGGYLLY